MDRFQVNNFVIFISGITGIGQRTCCDIAQLLRTTLCWGTGRAERRGKGPSSNSQWDVAPQGGDITLRNKRFDALLFGLVTVIDKMPGALMRIAGTGARGRGEGRDFEVSAGGHILDRTR